MTALEPARLGEVGKDGKVTGEFPVQFNPATLRLQMTNSTEGGQGRGRQVQQHNGSASTTLSVDLEFDTADEGTTAEPVDVRTLTNQVRKFLLPGGQGSKQAPPRVRFRWGRIIVIGVMDQLTEEHDLFSSQGVPLRSKLSVQIKEQDPKFEALERGAGANPAVGAPVAGAPNAGAGPGSSAAPGGAGARADEAQDGETAADLLSRNGADPAAWRAVAGAGDGLELDPGTAVDFDPAASASRGVGAATGFASSVARTVEDALGLAPTATEDATAAGFALAAAGGLTAAGQQAAVARSAAGADAARAAFEAPAPPPGAAPAATPSQADIVADRRAVTFGSGVPLRRRATPDRERASAGPWTVIGARQSAADGGPAPGRTGSPWASLPPGDRARQAADAAQEQRTPRCGCRVCHPVTRRFSR